MLAAPINVDETREASRPAQAFASRLEATRRAGEASTARSAHCLACGGPLPRCATCGAIILRPNRPGGAPPRRYCGEACRRQGDARARRIRRRREALDAWLALRSTPGHGGYSRDRIRREVRELKAELLVLSNKGGVKPCRT
jgi:hypothetical protein